jgi:hypothetical protein
LLSRERGFVAKWKCGPLELEPTWSFSRARGGVSFVAPPILFHLSAQAGNRQPDASRHLILPGDVHEAGKGRRMIAAKKAGYPRAAIAVLQSPGQQLVGSMPGKERADLFHVPLMHALELHV